jgi:uncharacterized protein (DUF1330 family)
MPAYVVTLEKDPKSTSIRSIVKRLAPASFKEHPVVFRARHGRQEVLEGAAFEEILILDFPGDEEAKAWYHSPEYQAESEPRFRGGDYSFILTDGIAPEWLATLPIYHCGLTEISFRGRSWGSRRQTTPWES